MRILFLLPLLIAFRTVAQPALFRIDQKIPFTIQDQPLNLALAGGLNAVQVNSMDADGDGREDLILWDRMGKCVKVFLKLPGGGYHFSPNHEKFFPRALSSWLLIRDLNNDG
ncbi:MAG: hypothetical protein ACKORJ_00550, partial [Bacteroidota bacterium]